MFVRQYRILVVRYSRQMLAVIVCLLCLLFLMANFPSMRDTFLPVLPLLTRGIPTSVLLRMRMAPQFDVPRNMTARMPSCNSTIQAKSKGMTLFHNKMKSLRMASNFEAPDWSQAVELYERGELRSDVHSNFMPMLTYEDRRELVQTFKVVTRALEEAGVPYFLVAGTLLGAYRYNGLVPWDDDLDIAVNVQYWDAIRRALGCIHGYGLFETTQTHWKFSDKHEKATKITISSSKKNEFRHVESPSSDKKFQQNPVPSLSKSSSFLSSLYREKTDSFSKYLRVRDKHANFPFVDLFFYTEDKEYIWATEPYLLTSVLFRRKDVYPLRAAKFEDLTVPVPRRTKEVLEQNFGNISNCVSPSIEHKVHQARTEVTIPCSELTYLYPMKSEVKAV